MKKIFVISLIVFFHFQLLAQTQVGGTDSPMYIKNGMLGVGTDNPEQKLDLSGKLRLMHFSIPTATWDNLMMWADGEKSFIQSNGDEKGLFIKSNLGNKIILQSQVGIGTEIPEESLHVNGDVLFDLFAPNEFERGLFFRKGFSNTNKYNLGILLYDHNSGGLNPDGITITAYDGVSFSTGSNSRNERMRINWAGDVGIGTKYPKSKLEVVGTITATEIKVEAQTADFVFEEDYQLKSLEEVDQYVQENKHLPDIPSAKQMEEEGVGLAEMNKLLLQKVEELTLYVIQQNKKIKILEEDNQNMKHIQDELKMIKELLTNNSQK